MSGSKQLTFRLDPESRYSAAIRDFFVVGYDRERQTPTVPVDVWNLLEDVADRFQGKVDGFVELFGFGSYQTGEYYVGSDIELLLVHTAAVDVTDTIDTVTQQVGDDRPQVISVGIEGTHVEQMDDTELSTRSGTGHRHVAWT